MNMRPAMKEDAVEFHRLMEPYDAGQLTTKQIEEIIERSAYTFHAPGIFLGGLLMPDWVWMISTPEVARNKKFYLRQTRKARDDMIGMVPVLRTIVDVRYQKSLRWLKWLGFSIGAPKRIGDQEVCLVELKRDV